MGFIGLLERGLRWLSLLSFFNTGFPGPTEEKRDIQLSVCALEGKSRLGGQKPKEAR